MSGQLLIGFGWQGCFLLPHLAFDIGAMCHEWGELVWLWEMVGSITSILFMALSCSPLEEDSCSSTSEASSQGVIYFMASKKR